MKMNARHAAGQLPKADLLLSAIDAERAVLGAVLIDPSTFQQVSELLRATDFVDPAHRLIYAAGLQLSGRGEPVDEVTMLAELRPLAEVGEPWIALLASLARSVPHAHHAMHYARIVWHASKRRQLTSVLEHYQGRLAEGLAVLDIIAGLRADLEGIEGTDAQ